MVNISKDKLVAMTDKGILNKAEEEINKKINDSPTANLISGSTPIESKESFKEGFLRCAKWILNEVDFWSYIEDNELPELYSVDNNRSKSKELLVRVTDNEYDFACLIYHNRRGYFWEFMFQHEILSNNKEKIDSDVGHLEHVICWMEIPQEKNRVDK